MSRLNLSAAESVSEVSAALVPRAAELAADIYRLIVREIPALRGDQRILALLEASVAENVATDAAARPGSRPSSEPAR
jgi:hypothetical protein